MCVRARVSECLCVYVCGGTCPMTILVCATYHGPITASANASVSYPCYAHGYAVPMISSMGSLVLQVDSMVAVEVASMSSRVLLVVLQSRSCMVGAALLNPRMDALAWSAGRMCPESEAVPFHAACWSPPRGMGRRNRIGTCEQGCTSWVACVSSVSQRYL